VRQAIPILLLASLAVAQDPIPVRFDAGSVDIMPGLSNPQRYQLKRWLGGPFRNLQRKAAEIRKVNETLQRERDKDKRAKLIAQRRKAQAELAKIRKQGRAALEKIGLKPEQIDRLNSIPKGELRRERYNHGVMLEAPGLTDRQVTLVRACIAATDSAQLTLALQRRDVKRSLADQDEKLRRRVTGDLNNRIRAIEKRFWIAMYYLLTPDQMRATKPLRCPVYQRVGDHRNHLYMLPGLSATQAGRINSLLNEITSETAADNAMIRSLNARIRKKDTADAERKELRAQLSDAYRRRGRIYSENYKAIRELMNDEQEQAWDSIPPQIAGGESGRGVLQNLRGLPLRAEQGETVRKLGNEAEKRIRDAQKAMREETKELRESGMGSDSPQMMMMSNMQRGLQGDRARILRELGHRYCVEVFEPEQLAEWLATGPARP